MSVRNKNFMMIPNKMWEKLYEMRIPGQARRVFDYIYRQRLGYPEYPREVSTHSITKALGIPGTEVRKLIVYLVENKMVVRNGIFKEIQKDFTLWGVAQKRATKKVAQKRALSSSPEEHSVAQKRALLKETPKDREKKGFLSKQDKGKNTEIERLGFKDIMKSIKQGKVKEGQSH